MSFAKPPPIVAEETFIQGMFNKFTEISSSLSSKIWSKMMNPLSVTFVSNISDFYENSITDENSVFDYYHKGEYEKTLLVEKPCDCFEIQKCSRLQGLVEKNENKQTLFPLAYNFNNIRIQPDKKAVTKEDQNNTHSDIAIKQSLFPPSIDKSKIMYDPADNSYDSEDLQWEDADDIEQNLVSNSSEDNSVESFIIVNNSDVLPKTKAFVTKTPTTLSQIWYDVTNHLTSGLQSVFACGKKQLCLSKQRRGFVMIGKGHSRKLRSLLRRTTKHQKKRSKRYLAMDVQDDYNDWQDLEIIEINEIDEANGIHKAYEIIQNNDNSLDVTDDLDDIDGFVNPNTSVFEQLKIANTFMVFDVVDEILAKGKRRTRDDCIFEYSPKNIEDYHNRDNDEKHDLWKDSSRLRTISENSIESEDGFIVFADESDADVAIDLSYDITNCEDDDSEDEDYNEENSKKLTTPKVKFNLIPIVHTMIQWDYAYRAARKGPWEEMARDRERFIRRVRCIAAVLDPILTSQHRIHIWKERFAPRD